MNYVAVIEKEPDSAFGVWFPDVEGCFSAGDTMDEALINAPEAIQLYADALDQGGRDLPRARSLFELKSDPTFVEDVRGNLVAVVLLPEPAATAAE